MDSVDEIAYMVEFAAAVPMDGTIEWLKKMWMVD
jgi:hypothetical protein